MLKMSNNLVTKPKVASPKKSTKTGTNFGKVIQTGNQKITKFGNALSNIKNANSKPTWDSEDDNSDFEWVNI
jgi:hypothetical protein